LIVDVVAARFSTERLGAGGLRPPSRYRRTRPQRREGHVGGHRPRPRCAARRV